MRTEVVVSIIITLVALFITFGCSVQHEGRVDVVVSGDVDFYVCGGDPICLEELNDALAAQVAITVEEVCNPAGKPK